MILTFECANFSLSVALLIERSSSYVLEEEVIKNDRESIHLLLPTIQELLSKAGVGFVDIETIATTIGPGSFTGIRVALSAAKGLGLVTGIKPKLLGSFQFVVQSYLADKKKDKKKIEGPIHVLLESGREEKFYCRFSENGKSLSSPSLANIKMFAERFAKLETGVQIGNGWGNGSYMPKAGYLARLFRTSPCLFSEKSRPSYCFVL